MKGRGACVPLNVQGCGACVELVYTIECARML